MADPTKLLAACSHSLSELIAARLTRRQWLQASSSVFAASIWGLANPSNAFSFNRKTETSTPPISAVPTYAQAQHLDFDPVPKSTADRVMVPDGYRVDVFLPTGTRLSEDIEPWSNDGSDLSDSMAKRIGDFHNGIKFIGMSEQCHWSPGESSRGVLCISHHSTNPQFLHPRGMTRLPRSGNRPTSQIIKEMYAHGFSLTEVTRDEEGMFQVVLDSALNRRITADTIIDLSGPVKGSPYVRTAASPSGTQVRGSLGNSGMTVTPWGTVLIGEGHWSDYFYRDAADMKKRSVDANAALARVGIVPGQSTTFDWHKNDNPRFDRWNISVTGYDEVGRDDYRNEANTQGFIVETDPFNPHIRAVKRTALGRISHRDAWLAPVREGKPIVIYLTDDGPKECVYKFVSSAPWDPADIAYGLRAGAKYLDHGSLYVARFRQDGIGAWILLEYGQNGLDKKNKTYPFADQASLLVNTRLAADAVGATKLDRPGWAVTHGQTGEVYITITYDTAGGGKPQGHIIRWHESGGQPESETFKWDVYLFGGQPGDVSRQRLAGLSASNDFHIPNGLWSDPRGIIWIQTDESGHAQFSNSMMLAALPGQVGDGTDTVMVHGVSGKKGRSPDADRLKRFMTGPIGSQISGMDMTPDCKTMFVNIEHPGLGGTLDNMTSHWPDSQTTAESQSRPQSATVVIRRSDGKPIAAG